MAFTQNFNSNTFGPVHWELMGPIADRPATADLHTTYLSTDEGDGVLKAYLYTESGWMQMQGIEGFTGGGGGSGGGGAFIVNIVYGDEDTTLDQTTGAIREAINSGRNVVAISDDSFNDPQYGYSSISKYQLLNYKETVPTGSQSEPISTYEIEFNTAGVFASGALTDYPTKQDG